MALKSGFYNAIETSAGVYDRVYSADEYTNFYSAFLKDGVRRSGDEDLKCISDGLNISINAGFAICGSKWIHNDGAFSLPAVVPPVGQYGRIDGVFLRVDANESQRIASFIYRQGTPAETPEPPAKETATKIYELCLCYVNVAPNASEISIVDKRADSAVCGWVTSPVGYDEYFSEFESAFADFMTDAQNDFDSWFENVRNTLAVSTLFKQYTELITTTAATTTTATISIVQYDPTGVDILDVFVNGMRLIAGLDYAVQNRTITFNNALIAGTQILIVVYKSIDGAGLGSVSDEVTQLQEDVAELQEEMQEFGGGFIIDSFDYGRSFTLAADQYTSMSFEDIEKDGYTPVGIINVSITGLVLLNNFWIKNINGNYSAQIGIHNAQTVSTNVSAMKITVIYKKNAE